MSANGVRPTDTDGRPSGGGLAAPCDEALAQKSFRYTARGERVDPGGGVYWVSARELAGVVEAARANPARLNRFAFVPLSRRSGR